MTATVDPDIQPFDAAAFEAGFSESAQMLGLDLAAYAQSCLKFAMLVKAANQRLNLTAILEPRAMGIKHFGDSLSVLLAGIPSGAKVVDVGAGAGFPGIPLAIARPDLQVTLIDATARKVAFLCDAIAELNLGNTNAVVGRAEELGRAATVREIFDVAVWRGLGQLTTSSELCLPMVKAGGKGIAMKGPKLAEELGPARAMIGQLGAQVYSEIEVNLPDNIHHKLLVLEKIKSTSLQFPRSWSKIKR